MWLEKIFFLSCKCIYKEVLPWATRRTKKAMLRDMLRLGQVPCSRRRREVPFTQQQIRLASEQVAHPGEPWEAHHCPTVCPGSHQRMCLEWHGSKSPRQVTTKRQTVTSPEDNEAVAQTSKWLEYTPGRWGRKAKKIWGGILTWMWLKYKPELAEKILNWIEFTWKWLKSKLSAKPEITFTIRKYGLQFCISEYETEKDKATP